MLSASIVLLISLLYLGALFAIASFGDKRASRGAPLAAAMNADSMVASGRGALFHSGSPFS
jgi:hypothetical protein